MQHGAQGRLLRMAMQNQLQEAGIETALMSCLVLPDYEFSNIQVISIPRDRIIDAGRYEYMVSTV
ncbi:NERD nuclease, partial [Acinetobacter baumannii]|nr:NERD nuclease [Acinetobacter baumannii]